VKRAGQLAAVCGLGLLAWVPCALAAGGRPSQPTDPKATSPAGTIYAIPLDSARSDAAPHQAGTAGGAPPSSTPSSPGAAASSRASAGAGASSNPGSLVHSENGFGSSSVVPGTADGVRSAAKLSSGGGGAPTGTFALIAVVLLVGAYAGVMASRLSRR
jgi:hypothetical protein